MIPKRRMPIMTRVVMTGRRIKSSEMFILGFSGRMPVASGFLISTFAPGTSWSCPSVTTVSPGLSPSTIDS